MFASKYGNKFPLNLTGASATNPVASNSPAHPTTDRAIPRPTITPAPTPGSAPQATFVALALLYLQQIQWYLWLQVHKPPMQR